MRDRPIIVAIAGLLIAGLSAAPALAGDSLYGRVIEVRGADRVVLDYGGGSYELRLVGIDVPREKDMEKRAVELVKKLVLDKNARMRFEGRTESGEMRCRLFTDDPELGIREVAVDLVRAGLARRQEGFDFKYGELAAAEREARAEKRGVWGGQ
jgi:endonuclease YncB( thermonuclease family)